jgi:hypothetical protein
MERTIRIDNDPDFVALDAFMDSVLREKGLYRVEWPGSTSWIDPSIQPNDKAVRFKLCFYPGSIKMGVRAEYVEALGLEPSELECPITFAVLPSGVRFVGFRVQNDQAGKDRIARVLARFP